MIKQEAIDSLQNKLTTLQEELIDLQNGQN